MKTFYSFREVKYVCNHEVLPKEKESKKIEIELAGEESDSIEGHESKEEPHSPVLRRSVRERRRLERYTPPIFHFSFSLYITNDDLSIVRDEVDL